MLKKLKLSTKGWVLRHKKKLWEKKDDTERLALCKKCHAFHYHNSWHFEEPEFLEDGCEKVVSVHLAECPSCMEQEIALYETESGLVLGKA